jgi:hypothetical protein
MQKFFNILVVVLEIWMQLGSDALFHSTVKFQYKKKLLRWVLSQYDDATLKDLRKVVPNIKQPIMWSYEVWSELDAQMVRNCWRMARILHVTWNVDFALVDEREKNRMREESEELGALISKCDWVMMRCQSRLIFRWKGKISLS